MVIQKCPGCGKQVSDAKFCPECGAPLSSPGVSGGKAKSGPVRNTGFRDFFIIIGAIAVVTLGYFLLKTPEKMPAPPQEVSQPSHEDMDMSAAAGVQFPPDYASLIKMGNETMDAGNFAVAAEAYRRALEIDPSSPNVRTDFGACLHGMGLPQRALEEFHRVIGEHPEHAIANFNLGIVYQGIGQPDSARFYWEMYVKIDPDGPAANTARQYLKDIGG